MGQGENGISDTFYGAAEADKPLFGHSFLPADRFSTFMGTPFINGIFGDTMNRWSVNRNLTDSRDIELQESFNNASLVDGWDTLEPLFIKLNAMNDGHDMIVEINSFVNDTIRYESDSGENYADYGTTLMNGEGDCEDYAIMKYDLLRLNGIPEENMMIVMGMVPSQNGSTIIDGQTHGGHAVLVIRDNAGNDHVLDNGYDDIIPAENYNMIPVEAFRADERFVFMENESGDGLSQIYSQSRASLPGLIDPQFSSQ